MDPKRDGITLRPDPVWTDRYETERAHVEAASDSRLLDVFHVGSTAIPGVPGKPVLDVMPIYTEYGGARSAADRLVDEGFTLEHDGDDTAVCIRRDDDHVVAVRMHTVDAEQWRPILLFRDYLTDDPDARAEYARAKREAADAHSDDMEAYTDAKSEVVRSLTERAREAGYAKRLPEFA